MIDEDFQPDSEEARMATFFDGCARNGDMQTFEEGQPAKLVQMLRRWNIQLGEHVLEPGCGAGRLTAVLAEKVGAEGHVLAMDVSPGMLAAAEARRLPPQVRLVRGSVYRVPADDNWFDRVICFCAFPHFERPAEALSEMARVLRPGGSFHIDHFESAEAINARHRRAGASVEHHALPLEEPLRAMMAEAGIDLRTYANDENGYRAHGVLYALPDRLG